MGNSGSSLDIQQNQLEEEMPARSLLQKLSSLLPSTEVTETLPQCPKVEPPLYAQIRRGESCDWVIVNTRLQQIGESVDKVRQSDQFGIPRLDGGHPDNKTCFPYCNKRPSLSKVMSDIAELQWRHPSSGVTALHVTVCWNPPLAVLESFLKMNVQSKWVNLNLAWEKSVRGATPLHYACGNAADVEIIKALIQSACDNVYFTDTTQVICDSPHSAEELYTMAQTHDTGYTALHCAANSNASLDVMSFLLETNPQAVLVKDKKGKTPLGLLCHNFRQLLTKTIKIASDSKPISFEDDGRDTSKRIPQCLETLLLQKITRVQYSAFFHFLEEFWCKVTLLLRVAASAHAKSSSCCLDGIDFTTNKNLVHAVASLLSGQDICPPLLFKLLLISLPDQLVTRVCPRGDLPLHVAARATAYCTSADPSMTNQTHPKTQSITISNWQIEGNNATVVKRDKSYDLTNLDHLLKINPSALKVPNKEGMVPLEVAISANCTESAIKLAYNPGLKKILAADPMSLERLHLNFGLYPKIIATFTKQESCHETKSRMNEKAKNLSMLYQVIRNKPELMSTPINKQNKM